MKNKNKILLSLFIVLALVVSFFWGSDFKEIFSSEKTKIESTESNEALDEYMTSPVPEGMPKPIEPQNVVITDKKLKATLSITCETILDNIDNLDKEKLELVPKDGIILPKREITFFEGESVFDVLKRETKENNIHLEFSNTPIYNSAYIEGINNLYEFDCGNLSGWMYSVNGWFPNYGCSRYQVKENDVIHWTYTCDLGRDVKATLE